MHILLANDDGINAAGIQALLRAALKRGHRVTVCAPATQQSATSHHITLSEPIMVKEQPTESPMAKAYAVYGTPVDCVRLGLLGGLAENPDMVLSGINNGFNAGISIHYSGTVGAAMEGALYHLPAIAASIDFDADPENIAQLAEYVIQVAERYLTKPRVSGSILNINAPDLPRSQWETPVYAPMAHTFYSDGYDRCEGGRVGVFFCLQSGGQCEPAPEGTDQWYLTRNHPVFTFLGGLECAPESVFAQMELLG